MLEVRKRAITEVVHNLPIDARDEVYQHGLETVSEIKERTKAEGRRRCEEAS